MILDLLLLPPTTDVRNVPTLNGVVTNTISSASESEPDIAPPIMILGSPPPVFVDNSSIIVGKTSRSSSTRTMTSLNQEPGFPLPQPTKQLSSSKNQLTKTESPRQHHSGAGRISFTG